MKSKIKLICTLLVVIFIVSGCAGSKVNDEGKFLGVIEEGDIGYIEDIEAYEGWGIMTPEELDFIDEQVALEIGNIVIERVFSTIPTEDGEYKDVLENTNYIVYEVKDKDFYVVTRGDPNALGGGYSVAISKKNGAILKLWLGE